MNIKLPKRCKNAALHGGKRLENCTEQTDKTTDCTTKPPTLPSWKVSQIILTVVNLLSEEGYFMEGFDYMEMIRKKGIVLKEYSAFKSENLLELQKVSIGLWNEGLCLIFPDPQTGATCRMIAYNDNKSAAEVMQIIFHELAHIMLRHTQQSNLGEMEATLFSGVAMLLMVLEQQFHIGRIIAEKGDKAMLKGIQEGLMQKFNAQEVL